MSASKYFISCDWGTTNFRLRAVLEADLTILSEHSTNKGVKNLNDEFVLGGKGKRLSFFAAYLQQQLAKLPPEFTGSPLVVSGMATANIGMRELPYGVLPIEKGASHFVVENLMLWPGQQALLVSGIKAKAGMMRGEETQALGLLKHLQGQSDGVLLLPGTHSKHLHYSGESFTGFTSFMTGELFEILSQKSILANSIKKGTLNTRTKECFLQGVRKGFTDGFPAHLFSIRAGHVISQTDPTDSFYHLSGLLIGDELSHLPKLKGGTVYLAGTGPLYQLYCDALKELDHGLELEVFDGLVLINALLSGQRQLLRRNRGRN